MRSYNAYMPFTRHTTAMCMALLYIAMSCSSNDTESNTASSTVSEATSTPYTGEALPTYVMIAPGTYDALIMDSLIVHPKFDSISKKIDAAFKRNPKLLEQLQKITKKGEALPYHPGMGVSREDYVLMQVLMTRNRLAGRQHAPVEVYSKDGFYYFKSNERLQYLRGVAFDSVYNIFYVDTARLFTQQPSLVPDTLNYFGSAWAGHTYKSKHYMLLEAGLTPPDKGILKAYKITVGRLHPSGRIFMLLVAKEFVNGKLDVSLEETIYLSRSKGHI